VTSIRSQKKRGTKKERKKEKRKKKERKRVHVKFEKSGVPICVFGWNYSLKDIYISSV